MNCCQTQELISAYLDQELTGHQMLEISAHLSLCHDCAREWRETAAVRRLLRALPPPRPAEEAECRLTARLSCPEMSAWEIFTSFLTTPRSTPALRGRRLAAALALSCVTILTVAPPFAPPTGDAAVSSGSMATLPPVELSPLSMSLGLGDLGAAPFLHMALFSRHPTAPRHQSTLPDVSAVDAEPLRDVTDVDYEQGNVALADYRASGTY